MIRLLGRYFEWAAMLREPWRVTFYILPAAIFGGFVGNVAARLAASL